MEEKNKPWSIRLYTHRYWGGWTPRADTTWGDPEFNTQGSYFEVSRVVWAVRWAWFHLELTLSTNREPSVSAVTPELVQAQFKLRKWQEAFSNAARTKTGVDLGDYTSPNCLTAYMLALQIDLEEARKQNNETTTTQ